MDDRELLELAAKAAEIQVVDIKSEGVLAKVTNHPLSFLWNPLTNDGDALRLAVKLRISIDPREGAVCVISACKNHVVLENFTFDQYPATRLAIVRAAAEIGRAMP